MSSQPRHKFFLKWLLVIPFFLFFQITLGRAVFSGIDILKQHIPMKYFNAVSFKAGHFPLWNPLVFQGYPHFAEGQSGPLYIGNLLMYVESIDRFISAYSMTVILHFVLGGLLCYIFFRRKNLSPLASFFASISITYSPFIIIHASAPSLHQVAIYFPLMLLLYDAAMKRPLINTILGGLLCGMLLLIGHVQMVVYAFIALFIYAVFIGILDFERNEIAGRIKRSIGFFIGLVIFGAGLAAIQLLPTMELSALTVRGVGSIPPSFYEEGAWFTLPRLASIFVCPALDNTSNLRDYGSSIIYFGVLPVLLFLICWRDENFKRKSLPWLLCFGILFLLSMGLNNPVNYLLIKIPPFNLFRYIGRYAYFAGFFLAFPLALSIDVAIGRGQDLIKEGGFFKNVWRESLILFALIIIMLLFSSPGKFLLIGLVHFVITFVIAVSLIALAMRRMSREIIKIAVFAHILMFLAMSFCASNLTQIYKEKQDESLSVYREIAHHKYSNKATYIASDRMFISAADIDNYLLTPQDKITFDASGSAGLYKWGVPNVNGYTPLKYLRREMLNNFIVKTFTDPPEAIDLPFMEYLLYDILGINFLIISGKEWRFAKYQLAIGPLKQGFDDDTYLYIARSEHPGFYLRENDSKGNFDLKDENNPVDFYLALYNQERNAIGVTSEQRWEYRHLALLETGSGAYKSSMHRSMKPAFPEYEIHWDGLIEHFTISDPLDAYDGLLIHESVYPGWEAYVNGNPVDIQTGDGLFKFIELGKGEDYKIEMRYFPQRFKNGMYISLITLGLWILVFIPVVLNYRRDRREGS
jgi:hypothetical protein